MKRVLIAEGQETLRDLYQSYLWDQGYDVETAADDIQCIAMLRDFVPQVLVLDHHLPRGGSEGVLAWLRQRPASVVPSVVLMVETDDCVPFTHACLDPVAECLIKPVPVGLLSDAVRSVLHRAMLEIDLVRAPLALSCGTRRYVGPNIAATEGMTSSTLRFGTGRSELNDVRVEEASVPRQ